MMVVFRIAILARVSADDDMFLTKAVSERGSEQPTT
jgi:hypothetical protein